MAIDVNRLALKIKTAFVAAGALDNPVTMGLSLGIAQGVVDELGQADVLPDGSPIAMKVGGAPVTGTGRLA